MARPSDGGASVRAGLPPEKVRRERAAALGASWIGSGANAFLGRPGAAGKVLAVLSGAVYLSATGGEILWICREGSPLHRRGIGVPRMPLLTQGQGWFARPSGLAFDGGPEVNLEGAAGWVAPFPGPEEVASPKAVREKFRQTLAVMDLLEIPDGMGPSTALVSALVNGRPGPLFVPGSLAELAKDRVGNLARDCLGRDLGSAVERVKELIGLGPGLTPSGDDYAGGLFFAAHSLSRAYPAIVPEEKGGRLAAFLEWARTRTHPVSHAMLGDLAAGQGPGPLHEFLRALLGREEDFLPAVDAALHLTRIGHASGWDMLAGFMTGMLFLEKA